VATGLCLALLLSPADAAAQATSSSNLELVGSLPLTQSNGDVWAMGNYAYVGTHTHDCFGAGVNIIDTSDPSRPFLVGTLSSTLNAEDVVVKHVETPFFSGDLLVTGIQFCESPRPGQRGVAVFDVTNPWVPQQLSFFDTTTESLGVHELDLLVKDGRAFALLATLARFRMVEVTDPRNPVQIADWHLTERLGEPLTGPAPLNSKFPHSALASPDGTLAFLSYWDAGVIILDISDPANPRYLGRTFFGPGEEGSAHSVSASPDNRLLLQADEDCSAGSAPPYNDFGFLRIWDISNPQVPQQFAIFHSPHSHPDPQVGPPDFGAYCIHNPFLVGDLGFLSWYTDGIRAIDLTDPARPQEIGWFVSPGAIWGVYVQPERENLVLASDFDFGLYILRPVRPQASDGGIFDAASYATVQSGSAAPVAPGAIVSLFGRNLAGATATAPELPLPRRLAGTRVLVNGAPAALFYASPTQINFQLPGNVPVGRGLVRVQVENSGRLGAEVIVNTVLAAPGIFTLSGDGRGAAAALRGSDLSPVNAAQPARAGDVVAIFLSGLNGAVPSVTVGGRNAEVLFSGSVPGLVGLWQLNFRVPAGLTGDLELRVTAAGVTSNPALLPVQ
jgi:uncharacterized protein (TIGR03437 family)